MILPPATFSSASATTEADGAVVLETDLYRIRLDPQRGGVITSLLVKDGSREVVDTGAERRFNEYRGYFVSEKKWASSADSPASVTISERGPVRLRAQVSGNILGRRFQTTITLAQGERRIDFGARFTYDQDTWIGDPWDISPADRRTERRRSPHDGRFKLQAFFPVPLRNRALYKNAAFDVCKSRNENTWFQGWHEIKHNIVLNWVDVVDEHANAGLAVFSDHTTAYTHGPDHPLALVMGWGWEGGYWWGKCPLRGTQQVRYALLPHTGAWDRAQVSRENTFWSEPLVGQIVDGVPVRRRLVLDGGSQRQWRRNPGRNGPTRRTARSPVQRGRRPRRAHRFLRREANPRGVGRTRWTYRPAAGLPAGERRALRSETGAAAFCRSDAALPALIHSPRATVDERVIPSPSERMPSRRPFCAEILAHVERSGHLVALQLSSEPVGQRGAMDFADVARDPHVVTGDRP